jgi:predicted enzyme related to lactoylglutathione lyase
MDLKSVRVITSDVPRLVAFYEQLIGLPAQWLNPAFAEIVTPSCRLAISAPAVDGSVIIEFRVDDVDTSYEAIKAAAGDVVQEPATMPWGNRSALLRDPDGNLVNLFAPQTEAARARFDGPVTMRE